MNREPILNLLIAKLLLLLSVRQWSVLSNQTFVIFRSGSSESLLHVRQHKIDSNASKLSLRPQKAQDAVRVRAQPG